MPTRSLSLVVALAVVAWTPLWCCCLMAQAAAHDSVSHCEMAAAASCGSCHSPGSVEPTSDPHDVPEAPQPCQCPDVVKQRLLEADAPVYVAGGGRALPDTPWLSFNAWATAILSPMVEATSVHAGPADLPHPPGTPSLVSMSVLLTI